MKTALLACAGSVVPFGLLLLPKPLNDFFEWYGYEGTGAEMATLLTILVGVWAFGMVFLVRSKV